MTKEDLEYVEKVLNVDMMEAFGYLYPNYNQQVGKSTLYKLWKESKTIRT